MINIISRAAVSKRTSGPKKVVSNLIKGLEKIGYPYVVNARLDACQRLWIHDDTDALLQVPKLKDVNVIVGPNLYISSTEIPADLDLSTTLYVQPSSWVTTLWIQQGFSNPMAAWPVGIDTDAFTESTYPKDHVLVYFKKRTPEELAYAEELLKERSIPYKVVKYGTYIEGTYRDLLAKSRYVLWIGCPESQGIALEEALASNVPVLVWDSSGIWGADVGATTAPYFDDQCGIVTNEKEQLANAITQMEGAFETLSPRSYILKNLTLEKQARDFVDLYTNRFGLSYEAGLSEKVRLPGTWKNATMRYRIYQSLKDAAKAVLKR